MERYFLVFPGRLAGKDAVYFWMEENGDNWVHIIRGVWEPKHEDDRVRECAAVSDITHLDWEKTPLHDQALPSGWLDRTGRFYGCPSNYHDKLAYCVLGIKVKELEDTGWVRVYRRNYYTCEHRLSAEQRNWLSENGHRIYDVY